MEKNNSLSNNILNSPYVFVISYTSKFLVDPLLK